MPWKETAMIELKADQLQALDAPSSHPSPSIPDGTGVSPDPARDLREGAGPAQALRARVGQPADDDLIRENA